MKRQMWMCMAMAAALLFLSACGGKDTSVAVEKKLKVGMVCDSVSVDDRSFMQATWEGVTRAAKDFNIETKYLIPSERTTAGFLQAIANLYDAGFRMIVTPGYTFSEAIHEAQFKYTDCYFVILDSSPQAAGADKSEIADNCAAIDYAAQESGFVAGFAGALQLKKGSFGSVFGIEIPPTKLFKTGFLQGVIYANENYGCDIKLKEENFVWSGTFSDAALGQQIAGQLFNSGVNLVYCAAGTTALGGFNEAKARAEKGEQVWVVGCDVDMYEDGLLSNGRSVTMTSTMKNLANSTYDMIQAAVEDRFEGGRLILFDAKNNGVGIPPQNPNLDDPVQAEADKILLMIKNGEIAVSAKDTDISAWR
ncbi:MAG: BMP family ABC transporter substrate-binding protein [Treponema sp.]|nr:BMP family ABC transporter substrate-binding protein [Treponema sp.]